MTLTIWGFDSWQQQEYSPQASRSVMRPTQPPIQCVLGVPSSGSNSWGVKLTAHPHQGPRLTMNAAAPLHPICLTAWSTTTTLKKASCQNYGCCKPYSSPFRSGTILPCQHMLTVINKFCCEYPIPVHRINTSNKYHLHRPSTLKL